MCQLEARVQRHGMVKTRIYGISQRRQILQGYTVVSLSSLNPLGLMSRSEE